MHVGYVEVDRGVRVRYALLPGGGRPVFIVHGLGGGMGEWLWLARDLASRGFEAVLVELRGHGGSSRSLPRPPSLADYARDVIAVADELGYPRGVAGVGFSLGGYALLKAEDLRPGFLERVVLVSSAHRAGDREGMLERARLAKEGRLGELAERIAGALGVGLEAARSIVSRLDPELYASTVESLASEDLSRSLMRVASRGAAYIVAGSRDALLGGEVLSEALGLGARVIVVEGAGHFLAVEARGRLLSAVLEALAA